MTSTADAKRAVRETIEKLGGLDLIIANAVRSIHCTLPDLSVYQLMVVGLDPLQRVERSREHE